MRVAICFSQMGPYHLGRLAALRAGLSGDQVLGVEIAGASRTYGWVVVKSGDEGVITLCKGSEEEVSFLNVFRAAWRFWRTQHIEAAFLPSYSPASSLALLLSAKLSGVRCIMMNESHAGTERARGVRRWLKRRLVSLFHGAIVGGGPHRRHFVALGMKPERIVTGYDAIDNHYFAKRAAEIRENPGAWRKQFHLPSRYFLSLGRMVEKKNLMLLIETFALVKRRHLSAELALVFVGSGECQPQLVQRCGELGLSYSLSPSENAGNADVLFYGFRQIDENPVFYALAEAFVLPSLYEEWGLVVNEAMACGLPVLVSSTVGSAEDLVVPGENGFHFDPRSSTELADHMTFLLEHPEQRERMGLVSAERIKDWGCENFALQAKQILTIVTTSSE